MAEADRDTMLREMAENRGCKLVKSRRRKPGVGDFGRYGLKDAKTGQEVFGFGDDGLTASAEEIEQWLRGGAIAEWKRSLKAAAGAPPTRAKAEKPAPANDPAPEPARARSRAPAAKPAGRAAAPPPPAPAPAPPPPPPPPPPEPKLVVRDARPGDAEAIAALAAELGFADDVKAVRRRMASLAKAGEPVLVADEDGVRGCLAWTVWTAVHRPKPVGRITMLVVTEKARRRGIGAALLAEAEARFRKAGCGLGEVTSNIELGRAHAFYRDRGYERTSYRFGKRLEDSDAS